MAIDAAGRQEVARLYAGALLELVRQRRDTETEEVLEQLAALAERLDAEPELARLFASPLVDEEERAELLDRALRGHCDELVVDTLQVMNQKGRLGLVRELAAAVRELEDEARGITPVRVVSARALEPDETERVRGAAERLTGDRVRMVEEVDPELIAGMVLYTGDRKVDLSLQRELEESTQLLAERISREMQAGGMRFVEETEA